ncbi:hypothetical protein SRABI96_01450 [Peribacillus sp. Bi96]|nr:hypothetical protein SRABI96_01450 [Peribacillus sp. Bi96]
MTLDNQFKEPGRDGSVFFAEIMSEESFREKMAMI